MNRKVNGNPQLKPEVPKELAISSKSGSKKNRVLPKDANSRANKKSGLNILWADTLSSLLWIYLIIKIFVIDFDLLIIQKLFPDLIWLLKYKFFILIGIASILMIVMKGSFYLLVIYVIFFPFLILLWKIPKLLWKTKSWTLFLSLLNFTLTFFKNFKVNFISKSFALISFFIILISKPSFLLFLPLVYLLAFLLFSTIRSISQSFRPSEVFTLQHKLINKLRNSKFGKSMISIDKKIKNKPIVKLDDQQLTTFTTNLQMVVVFNRFCYFFAHKLEEYKESKINALFNMWSYLWLFIQIVLIFTFINLGLYKINYTNFKYLETPNFYHFLYYSFNSVLTGGIEEFYPATGIAIITNITMKLFGLLLLPTFLINIIFSIREQKFNKNIESAIKAIKKEGDELDKFIKSEYKLTTRQAIKKLAGLKAGMINLIYNLSKEIPTEV